MNPPDLGAAQRTLWPGLTSRARTSTATAPRLPAADQDRGCVIGRTRDLPVPEQRASAHARVSDHAGPSGHSRSRARPCCLPRSETRRHPGPHFFRGSMAGLCTPLPTLRRHPRGCQRTTRGRGGFATPSSWRTCTPYSLPVSRRTQIKFELIHSRTASGTDTTSARANRSSRGYSAMMSRHLRSLPSPSGRCRAP